MGTFGGPNAVQVNPVASMFPNGQATEIFNPLKSLYDTGTSISQAAPGAPSTSPGWSLRNLYLPVIAIVVLLWAVEHRRLSVSARIKARA